MSDLIELGDPDVIRNEDNILWLRAEIERLRKEVDRLKQALTIEVDVLEEENTRLMAGILKRNQMIERLQARVEVLKAALWEIRIEPGDARGCRYIAGQALAATEHGESDE